MTFAERIFEEAKALPEQEQEKVLDFALFLKDKQKRELDELMDRVIDENMEALRELAK